MTKGVSHENCGYTKWTCECGFQTRCTVEAMNHEHEYLDAEISLTQEQMDKCFGVTKKEESSK